MKKIMVTLEFEKNAYQLLNKARELAKAFEAKVWLLHVAAPDPDFVGYDVGPQYIRDFRAGELREEHRYLEQFARDLMEDGIETQPVLLQGGTVDMILEESKKNGIELIITGHHDKSVVEKILKGSVSKQLLEKSEIPMLIIPIEQN